MIIRVLEKNAPDALVVPLAQQENLGAQLAALARLAGLDPAALQNDFKADPKEVFVVYATGTATRKFYLVGLGKKDNFQTLYTTLRAFCFRYRNKLPRQLGIDLRHFPAAQLPRLADAAVSGMLLGLYQIGLYRKDPEPNTVPLFGGAKSELQLLVKTSRHKEITAGARRGEVFAGVIRDVFDLMNAPGNKKNPGQLSDWIERAGKDSGLKVRILSLKELKAKKLDALLAVGQGSPHPPAMALLEYRPKAGKSKVPLVGLVGKGVTFDTGGVSLKPSSNMHFMKSDMGGAAAVFGALLVAAQLELPVQLVAAVPIAENMIDGLAIKPGDVIGSHAGKTIEVIDTDAEGRLILADGVSYLHRQEKPDVLIDIATLTGSIIRTLGYAAAGLFTQNDQLAAALTQAGENCGERLWRLPLWEEYAADLKSDVADIRNFSGKPMAEAITAAKFIEQFTDGHPAWAHLDIAGMAFGDTELGQSKTATGYGVRLLVEFVEQWIAK
ncbi:MAG: leucyl aminopeptidase family protein [Saprospiraceae bacterium]|nr:leucyl aminopeptidase family protein [Saprospiraceae bacterium]